LAINLKNKKVLITAGPTWVKIDRVRVISNAASAETGILLAKKFSSLGAKVTLLLGSVNPCCLDRGIRLIRFKFFEELKFLLERELFFKRYDLAIHSAAVSDYEPASVCQKKIKSGLRNLKLKLKPTPKIINLFRKIHPGIFLVGFKYEVEASRKSLIQKARQLIKTTQADLVVANTLRKEKYIAYLVTANKCSGPIFAKSSAVNTLIKAIKGSIWEK